MEFHRHSSQTTIRDPCFIVTTANKRMAKKDGKKMNAHELQRRIFLNTMRSVYPDSIQLNYTRNLDLDAFTLEPRSVESKLVIAQF